MFRNWIHSKLLFFLSVVIGITWAEHDLETAAGHYHGHGAYGVHGGYGGHGGYGNGISYGHGLSYGGNSGYGHHGHGYSYGVHYPSHY